MNQDKMHLINKIFNNKEMRIAWDKDQEKYFISDGKYRLANVCDTEEMYRIIVSISSKNKEVFGIE